MSRPARSPEPDSSTKLAELEALQAVIEGLTAALHSLDKTGHSVASIHLNSAIEVLRADEIRMAIKLGVKA